MLMMAEDHTSHSLIVHDDNCYVGLIGQNPNHPDVLNPGKWFASLITADGGLVSLDEQDCRVKSMRNFVMAYDRHWTYHQWMNGGWNRMFFTGAFTKIVLAGYPGWETLNDKPCFVMFELVNVANDNKPPKSHAMALEFDDIAAGTFYYRDWTSSGIPVLCDGETYWSGFSFQFRDDAVMFQEMFGGFGNWQEEYKEFEQRCNETR